MLGEPVKAATSMQLSAAALALQERWRMLDMNWEICDSICERGPLGGK